MKKNRLTSFDWDKAGGTFCFSCGQEVVRLNHGLCPQCHGVAEENIAKKMQDKSERRYYKDQLRKGTISLAQMREGRLGS